MVETVSFTECLPMTEKKMPEKEADFEHFTIQGDTIKKV